MSKILLGIVFSTLAFLVFAEPNVVVLTDKTFEETLKKNPIVMVKFFAPWCGHCKSLAPEYELLAAEVKKQEKPYVIAEMDVTENKNTPASEAVASYPTIKLYVEGRTYVYGGARKTSAILDFIALKSGPFSTLLKTVEEIQQKKNLDKRICILASVNEKTVRGYSNVGEKIDGYEYYNAEAPLVAQVFPEAKEGNVVLLNNYGEEKTIFADPFTEVALEEFLRLYKEPIVVPIDSEIIKAVFNTGRRVGVLLIHEGIAPGEAADEFQKAALKLRSPSLAFTDIDIKEGLGPRAAPFLGLESCPSPQIMIVQKKDEVFVYKYEGKMVAEDIKQFVEDFQQGRVKRFIMSEEEPTDNLGPVYKAVGKTFNKEVLDNDMDVLVKFYAPWCGRCKELAPVFKALAQSHKDNKKLKFVEIDATKNTIEGHMIKFYPTIKLFPGKDKAHIHQYNGDRTEDDFNKFIAEKSSYPELFSRRGDL